MTFSYIYLAPARHDTAETAIQWVMTQYGIPKGRVRVEAPVDSRVGPDMMNPTFSAETDSKHIVCVDVAETVFATRLAEFALKCLQLGLPVKLYVALSSDSKDPDYQSNLRKASEAGIGLIEIVGTEVKEILHPMSLSWGSAPIRLEDFPKKYRAPLATAERTFRSGDGAKGCLNVHEEIEALFRRIAAKAAKKKFWNPSKDPVKPSWSWANLIDEFEKNVDWKQLWLACPLLTKGLVARVRGMTEPRNDEAHKRSRQALIRRDSRFRTTFDGAVHLLTDLIDASRPLKV